MKTRRRAGPQSAQVLVDLGCTELGDVITGQNYGTDAGEPVTASALLDKVDAINTAAGNAGSFRGVIPGGSEGIPHSRIEELMQIKISARVHEPRPIPCSWFVAHAVMVPNS
jgi:hypothetical protein